MYLIVGLGNPGKEYENTRHNMGFKVLNKLSKKYNIPITKSKFNGKYGTGIIENEKVILLEPQTYMNLSGEAIKPMLDFYKVDYSNLLVIYDDIDVEPGKVKIRTKGGPGTHKSWYRTAYNKTCHDRLCYRICSRKRINNIRRRYRKSRKSYRRDFKTWNKLCNE